MAKMRETVFDPRRRHSSVYSSVVSPGARTLGARSFTPGLSRGRKRRHNPTAMLSPGLHDYIKMEGWATAEEVSGLV